MTKNKQLHDGFTIVEVLIVLFVLAAVVGISLFAWKKIESKQTAKQSVSTSTSTIVTGQLKNEDLKKAGLISGQTTPTTRSKPTSQQTSTTTTSGQTSSAAQSGSTASPSTTSTPTNTSTTQTAPATTQKSTTTTKTNTSTTPTPPTTTNHPTAALCQSLNGANIGNVWASDNSSHTYQIWYNGGWITKTETGTNALGYDTMRTVGVIPFKTKAAWARCSDKPGYVMFYYHPSDSVYTYNWLVAFNDVSLVQP